VLFIITNSDVYFNGTVHTGVRELRFVCCKQPFGKHSFRIEVQFSLELCCEKRLRFHEQTILFISLCSQQKNSQISMQQTSRESKHKNIQGGSKNNLLILSEYVNKTEKIGGMWTNTNSYKENEVLSDTRLSREIFYVTIVICLLVNDWKQSMKLLLCKHELPHINMT